jgi:hypothetical protein
MLGGTGIGTTQVLGGVTYNTVYDSILQADDYLSDAYHSLAMGTNILRALPASPISQTLYFNYVG